MQNKNKSQLEQINLARNFSGTKRPFAPVPGKWGLMMSVQRQLFCQYVVEHQDAGKAALMAGYKNRESGKQLLRENDVRMYIKSLTEEINKKAALTVEYKLDKLKSVMDASISENKQELKETDPAMIKAGLSAIDLSCKIQGHYAPDKALNVNADVDEEKIKTLVKKYAREY